LVASSYQLVPRNYTVVNQSLPGTGVAIQLSPQQLGTNLGPATVSALSPIDQQQILQQTTFDPGISALHSQQPQQVQVD